MVIWFIDPTTVSVWLVLIHLFLCVPLSTLVAYRFLTGYWKIQVLLMTICYKIGSIGVQVIPSVVCLLGLGLGYKSHVIRMLWQYPDIYCQGVMGTGP